MPDRLRISGCGVIALTGKRSRADAFIKADRRGDAGLQPRMVVNIVPGKGLFDVVELETIQGPEDPGVAERTGHVGIRRQVHRWQSPAHRCHDVHILARLDLGLDAPVAKVVMGSRAVHRLFDRGDAARDAGVDLASDSAEERPERQREGSR